MRFIYPSFLWALIFIAVPIIIHILNLRRHRTVYFSNVNLLKIVKKENHRKSKIKQVLILACRILLIAALVFAFSRPYIPVGTSEKQHANNVVGIYIDNSYSMNAEGSEGKAFESAKQKSYAIVNSSKPDTRFALLTNKLDEQQNRFYGKSEILNLISDVQINYNSKKLSTIQLRINSMMENFLLETTKTNYFISDFQKFTSDISNFEPDSISKYNFIPIPVNNVSNIYIDTCWFESPTHHFEQVELLNVKIVNNSNETYPQIPINFYLNDSLKALTTTSIKAGEEKTITLQYTNLNKGLQFGRIEISDYPIVYDNTFYLAYNVKNSLNALVIQQNNLATSKNLQALFQADDFINLEIEQADRLQISSLSKYSIIIINELTSLTTGLSEELKKYINNGGTLVVIPAEKGDILSYNSFLSVLKSPQITSLDTIEIPINDVAYNHKLYSDVFKDNNQKVVLPQIKKRFRFDNNQQLPETNILTFSDNTKALSLLEIGEGKLYMFSFPLSESKNQFVKHLLFLPTFYNIVLQSAYTQKLFYVMGSDNSINVKFPNRSIAQNLILRHLKSGAEIIPTIISQKGNILKLNIEENFDAGFYHIFLGEELVSGIAFNYLLKESEFEYYKSNEIEDLCTKTGIKNFNIIKENNSNFLATIKDLDNGKQLWRIFILLGLIFLVFEALIIRFWP